MAEKSLVIGKGEIGKALFGFLREVQAEVLIRDVRKVKLPEIDILHIAFPYSEDFVKQVQGYIEEYDPLLTIIYSTLPIGTTESIQGDVVHSPIEGKHPGLEPSIAVGVRWLGSTNKSALADAVIFWRELVHTVRTVNSADYTEFLKLRSTAKYGINLVWTDYEAAVAKLIGMELDAIKQFDLDYNSLYEALKMTQFQRYILDPPNGKIGGHCVVPNAEILDVQYPHELLKMIKAMKKEK